MQRTTVITKIPKLGAHFILFLLAKWKLIWYANTRISQMYFQFANNGVVANELPNSMRILNIHTRNFLNWDSNFYPKNTLSIHYTWEHCIFIYLTYFYIPIFNYRLPLRMLVCNNELVKHSNWMNFWNKIYLTASYLLITWHNLNTFRPNIAKFGNFDADWVYLFKYLSTPIWF